MQRSDLFHAISSHNQNPASSTINDLHKRKVKSFQIFELCKYLRHTGLWIFFLEILVKTVKRENENKSKTG